MVLGSDGHLSGAKVFDGLIGAAMSEFQFERLAAKGERENLMSETYAEKRPFLRSILSNRIVRIRQRGGIAGSVGKEDSVRVHREDVGRRHGCRDNPYGKSISAERAQNVPLESEIVRDDSMRGGRQLLKEIPFLVAGRIGEDRFRETVHFRLARFSTSQSYGERVVTSCTKSTPS